MKSIFLSILGIGLFTAHAQESISIYISAEETIMLGDEPSSYDFTSWTTLAAQSGMRAGFVYKINEDVSIESTLGVLGVSKANTWFTKIVPVEVIGHYDILSLIRDSDREIKFNTDLGIGSSLVRAQSEVFNTIGKFSFSENISLGASLDILFGDFGMLTLGYRHTFFVDDYIDASIANDNNDHMGRFFTAVKLPLGKTQKTRDLITELNLKTDEANLQLLKLELEHNELKQSAQRLADKFRDTTLTLEGIIVSLNEGLNQTPKYILQSVHFEFNEYTIQYTDVTELNALHEILSTNLFLRATVVGHTDNSGSDKFNQQLSLKRAQSVLDFLISKGIDPTRLHARGAGIEQPVLPNSSVQGRKVNRRTEVVLY